MSLELTDEERVKVIELANSAASFVIHTPKRFLPIILKLQAAKMRAEFYNPTSHHCWRRLIIENKRIKKADCKDPRHTWKDEQWKIAAIKELNHDDTDR